MNTFTQRGFTIIELMIAVLVSAVLLTIGVPSFATLIANNRVTAQANELVGGLNLARSEAIKNGQRVSVCSSTDGSSCAANTDWATGWLVFNDSDGNGAVASADDILRAFEAAAGNSTITGSANFVTYQGDGSTNATIDFDMSIPNGNSSETRRVCVARAGNIWVNRPSTNC